MRVLVCGSRHFEDKDLLDRTLDAIDRETKIDTIIHGMARGADTLGGDYARSRGKGLSEYPALWNTHGRAAGPIRNTQMLKEGKPDLVVAFRGPNSRGTQNMIEQAKKAGVEVVVVDI